MQQPLSLWRFSQHLVAEHAEVLQRLCSRGVCISRTQRQQQPKLVPSLERNNNDNPQITAERKLLPWNQVAFSRGSQVRSCRSNDVNVDSGKFSNFSVEVKRWNRDLGVGMPR